MPGSPTPLRRSLSPRGFDPSTVAATVDPAPAAHPPDLIHEDRSRRFLAAAGTSMYGDWLTTVALVVLLYRLAGTPIAPALYFLVRVAPRVLGPAPGGSFADRFGPDRVAAWCALGQGACTASIVPLALAHILWPIYVMVAIAQLLGAMSQPAYSACIPRVTSDARLARVNALYSGAFESSVLVAPAAGALLLQIASPELLIALDAGSFLVAALLLLSLRVGPALVRRHPARGFGAALRVIARDPMLRAYAASGLCSAVVVTCLQAVLVVAAAQRFGHVLAVGWLYAAVGAGGVTGSLILLRWHPGAISRRGVVIGFVMEIAPLAAFALAANLAVALALLFVSTFAGAVYQTRGNIALQQRVPHELLGRVNGAMRMLLYAGMLVGAVGATALVTQAGWSLTVLLSAAGAIAIFWCASLNPLWAAPAAVAATTSSTTRVTG